MVGAYNKAKADAAARLNGTHSPAISTAAVVTIAAGGATVAHVIRRIHWSYNIAGVAGKLTVTDDGSTVFELMLPVGSHDYVDFGDHPIVITLNKEAVITLGAITDTTGTLNVQYQ